MLGAASGVNLPLGKYRKDVNSCRYHYFDTMRTFSIWFVVVAHVYPPWLPKDYPPPSDFLGLSIWNHMSWSMFGTCEVPIFFMISGALLIPATTEPLTKLYAARVFRMLLALVSWRIITLAVDRYWLRDQVQVEHDVNDLVHFWFLGVLIPLYIMLPLYRHFVASASNGILFYILLVWLINTIMIYPQHHPFFDTLRTYMSKHLGIRFPFFNGYQGYFLGGAFLQRFRSRISGSNTYFLLGICMHLTASFLYNFWSDHKNPTTRSDDTPSVILMSFGAFVWLMAKGDVIYQKFPKIVSLVSRATFGIYLCHFIVWKLVKYHVKQERIAYDILPHVILFRPFVGTCLIAMICPLVLCLQKIPFVRYIV